MATWLPLWLTMLSHTSTMPVVLAVGHASAGKGVGLTCVRSTVRSMARPYLRPTSFPRRIDHVGGPAVQGGPTWGPGHQSKAEEAIYQAESGDKLNSTFPFLCCWGPLFLLRASESLGILNGSDCALTLDDLCPSHCNEKSPTPAREKIERRLRLDSLTGRKKGAS
ncbi:hypothetical protein GW17_00033115 [Ensete ventricosum]|nr:hypothetical protein GW17_00033115 [Ensete ventricosum]